MFASLTLLILIGLFLCLTALFYRKFHDRLPLPPGPRGTFVSGVKSLMPSSEPWKTYAAWSREFDDPVISFRIYNRHIIVLNDVTSVQSLLDKRANIYSDRPESMMYNKICDRGKAVFMISSLNERHKQYRKLLQVGLGARPTKEFWPLLQQEVTRLLEGLASTPEEFEHHIRSNAAAVIMKMAFGYTVIGNDPFIQVATEASKISGWATAPGRWLVDYFPIVQFVPSFFPGTGWKRQGEEWRQRLRHLSDVPHEWVKDQMSRNGYTESFTSRLLRPEGKDHVTPEEEDVIKWCAGALYAGAGDTTVSALLSFLLLMAVHPEIQKRAQSEIDEKIGLDQVPHPAQSSDLTYLTAILKEVLRYAPVGNMALPHRVTEDDVFAGYRIPKDATVIANVWAIMHDPSIYPDPDSFCPDRFLLSKSGKGTVQPDPRQFAFGFGRRACPGIHFAETTMLLTMASILSKLDISLPPGEDRPTIEFTTGITSHIKVFDIRIIPRSACV